MPYWRASVPYEGTAYIVIKADKQPKTDDYRAYFQRKEIDKGLPRYYFMGKSPSGQKAEYEKIDDRQYKNHKRLMKRKSTINKLRDEILKEAIN